MAGLSELLDRARRVMPGGVSSPVRAFAAVSCEPPVIARARGAEITDTDGKTYVDLVGSFGPAILGHAHPAVVEAVQRAATDGLTFGATCEAEIELAERVLEHYPFAERVRFVSSGTEAVMSAVRLARGVTGRSRIVKFEGCYHGHADGLLVKGGSGLATLGTPSSAGVPPEIAGLTEVLPLDDEHAVQSLFDAKGRELAVVLIEPLPANAGLLEQRRDFLATLRRLCDEAGALLLFDEVISGFRVHPGGMTALTGITPDLVTLGKVLGGGLPVGAYAGPALFMERVAPAGPVYQAGTLSGNPLAMRAGLATLRELERPGTYERLEELGARLQMAWREILERHDVPGSIARAGSILWMSLTRGAAPRAWHQIDPQAAELYGVLFPGLLSAGAWLAPSAYEVAFLSTAHDEAHVDRAVAALDVSLDAWRRRCAT